MITVADEPMRHLPVRHQVLPVTQHAASVVHTMLRILVAFTLLMLHALPSNAQTLRVLTTGAFKQVVVALVPDFEARTGIKVELLADTAGALTQRIEAGERFDLLFLTPAGLASLSKQGKVDPESIRPVARVAIGVAVRVGSPLPPLETVEQFKQAVLGARKVAYIDPASGGSSGIYLDGLFQRLGIADAVRARAVLVPGGYAAERVANGEADLAIHQVSEILPVSGVTLAGLLPQAIQNYTTYGYGVATASQMRPAAASFAAVVNASGTADMIRAKGMERVQ